MKHIMMKLEAKWLYLWNCIPPLDGGETNNSKSETVKKCIIKSE